VGQPRETREGKGAEIVTDEEWANRLRVADRDAFTALVLHYTDDVFRLVSYVLGPTARREDIEDVVADAFVAAWQHGRRYDPARSPIRTWILMHAKYAALNYRRLQQRWGRAARRLGALSVADPCEFLAAADERTAIQQALNRLSPIDRDLVYRRYFLDVMPARLAEEFGMSRTALDTRLWRARQALKRDLARQSGEGTRDA
jgi:RNA polymerase sigma-70 factor (ECF subfamily)